MKKIGILYGNESSFPIELMERINIHGRSDVLAELMKVDAVKMDGISEYSVILDRVSNEVSFFRSMLKLAVLNRIHVVNNPFINPQGDNFFFNALSAKIGIPVPRTVVLPSKEHPPGTNSDTMRNMAFPLSWDEVFNYVGFPAYIKPNMQNDNQNCYKVYNPIEFFAAFDLTGNRSMLLQECIEYEHYLKSYIIGKKQVRLMHYDPVKPLNLRYRKTQDKIDNSLKKELEDISIKICTALDCEFNSVEFAIRKGKPFVIDFYNPAANAEKAFLHEHNFDWLVKTTAEYLIELTKQTNFDYNHFSWSKLLNNEKTAPIASPGKRGRPKKIK